MFYCRKREINGFGLWGKNEFRIFVNHENKGRHLLENMLRIFTDIFKTKLNLHIMVGKPCICFYSQQGDKIYTRSSFSEEANNKNSYGTLGGFVSDQNNDTFVLTCSHVCRKGDIIFADDNDHGRVRIGECVFSNDLQTTNINEFIDVALVKIDNDALKRCNLSMLNDTLQQSNVKIYLDNLQQIASKDYVYKIGASTSVTKGLITSPKVHLKITGGRAELFFVSDIDDSFAEKGDSGSIVFTIENSSALDTIYVIGMVSGVFTPHQPSGEYEKVDKNRKTDKKDDEGAKKEVSCTGDIACFRMDKTMEFLRKKGIDVSFKNQI